MLLVDNRHVTNCFSSTIVLYFYKSFACCSCRTYDTESYQLDTHKVVLMSTILIFENNGSVSFIPYIHSTVYMDPIHSWPRVTIILNVR
ncbi:hypothetical protein GDO78_019791 [Eleutherodactylus coqui]|uniref:Uncharacterized protein n=1 Tax=Eleutherodactylus coqui TaxID=57060 RepID=A0A8J6EIB0_ELECQ|nr:hypothetical protein GDO78_019791 [Eleutherodactylus coqui]